MTGAAAVAFRPPRQAILGAVFLAVCATPAAFAAPYLWLVHLVPFALVVRTLWVRTTADADGLTVRRIVGVRRVPWSAISSLRLRDQAGVRAVLTDGAELPLPSVRVRDLPRLAAASGGHVTMDPRSADQPPSGDEQCPPCALASPLTAATPPGPARSGAPPA